MRTTQHTNTNQSTTRSSTSPRTSSQPLCASRPEIDATKIEAERHQRDANDAEQQHQEHEAASEVAAGAYFRDGRDAPEIGDAPKSAEKTADQIEDPTHDAHWGHGAAAASWRYPAAVSTSSAAR
jgi:hypothetical protein